jgi:hypothetical protein
MRFFQISAFSLFLWSLFISVSSFVSAEKKCCSITRKDISKSDHALYDSLFKTESYKFHGRINFVSDTIQIIDTARIKPLPIDSNSSTVYYPDYLQFKGSFQNFIKYVLIIDPVIDSIVRCESRIMIYAANKCDFCDSGFFSPTQYFPTQFSYYRFHEIYGSFFSYKNIDEIQVFVQGVNKTYLPVASDFSVYAPNKTMKRKWYMSNMDYTICFPDDYQSNPGKDFTVEKNGDYIWIERAANKSIKSIKN